MTDEESEKKIRELELKVNNGKIQLCVAAIDFMKDFNVFTEEEAIGIKNKLSILDDKLKNNL